MAEQILREYKVKLQIG